MFPLAVSDHVLELFVFVSSENSDKFLTQQSNSNTSIKVNCNYVFQFYYIV